MKLIMSDKCTKCGRPLFRTAMKLYGDGSKRCWPKCVQKYEERLAARRCTATGRFVSIG